MTVFPRIASAEILCPSCGAKNRGAFDLSQPVPVCADLCRVCGRMYRAILLSIGYITNEKVLGLSKFGRIAQKHAHTLQLQEKLVTDIALDVLKFTGSENVAVVAKGEHLCMTMRGIQMPGRMISSSLHGLFKEDAAARAEFMALL